MIKVLVSLSSDSCHHCRTLVET